MCGIIGYIGKKNAIKNIINGLEKLEYRGYDSSGIAFLNNNKIEIIKEAGKISDLKKYINFDINSDIGLGHTRWATHGKANKINSHPHKVGKFTIVHNGIIENYTELKKELEKKNYNFISETDTEIACALLDHLYSKTKNLLEALNIFKNKVTGSYSIGLICEDEPKYLFAIKKENPLVIGLGKNGNYISSDIHAISKNVSKYITLEDFDIAKIGKKNIVLYGKNLERKKKTFSYFKKDIYSFDKNNYEHYMLKEIHEQPAIIQKLLTKYLNSNENITDMNFKSYKKIDIVACGSAYHAGLIGKYLIENYCNIEVNVEIASEYRYKKTFITDKSLVIIISQSGETADSLASLKIAKEKGAYTLAIVNVKESTIAKLADEVIYTEAGCEMAVATTKAYIAQIVIFILLTIEKSDNYTKTISNIDEIIKYIINKTNDYTNIANIIYKSSNVFYIGRGFDYALSLEGALKLKEISYINAQGYAAGELKHGSISIIEENTPVIALLSDIDLTSKTINNIKEVKARGAYVILITYEDIKIEEGIYDYLITIPPVDKIFRSILSIIPLQLIAYEIARKLNCDIDKPKNLAKSVTVE